MNNKGFAITGILYGLMLVFILALTSFLSILVGKNKRMDALTDSVYERIRYDTISVTLLNEPKVVVEPMPVTPDKLEYTTPTKSEETLEPGTYKLEVWGAMNGGYSYGTLKLDEYTKIYVYPGGTNGFNGGGAAGSGEYYWYPTSGDGWSQGTYTTHNGGGASDIRIGTDSLYARVIVAGGGTYDGGVGGGTSGGGSYVGSQISAGNGGSFGKGGAGTSQVISQQHPDTSPPPSPKNAGGGGWYGGGSVLGGSWGGGGGGGWISSGGGGNGGGSGWVYTASTYNTWKNGNATDAAKWLLDTKYYLTSAQTVSSSFTDFNGTAVTKGHTGNGAVRITKLSSAVVIPDDDNDGVETYTTTSKAIYRFNFNDYDRCEAFLPENVVIISGKMKGGDANKIYYKVGGSSNLEDFKELECLK